MIVLEEEKHHHFATTIFVKNDLDMNAQWMIKLVDECLRNRVFP